MTAQAAPDAIPFYQKPLYRLLDESFPVHRTIQGLFDVAGFAKDIRMTPEGVYKWIRSDRISVDGAHKVVDLSNREGAKPITKEQLYPFVMR